MQNDSIKLAVIGVGATGSAHARDFTSLSHTTLVAECDTLPECANYLAEKYHCRAYQNYQELLADCDPDAV